MAECMCTDGYILFPDFTQHAALYYVLMDYSLVVLFISIPISISDKIELENK